MRILRYRPTPKMSTMAGTPHTMPLTVELILLMVSSIYDTSFLYTIFYGICAGKGIKKRPRPCTSA